MSLEHDIWSNLAEKAAFMPDGVKFCGIICNAEVWLVKDKVAGEFLRRPSAKPAQVNPVPFASKKERAELRDRFAMAALAKLVGNAVPNPVSAKEAWEWADMMLATRGDDHEPKGEQR